MSLQGKVWGSTELLLNRGNVEVQRLEIKKNGYCSKHKHNAKYNMFYVEEGSLQIEVWKNDYDLCDITTLKKGQSTIIPPREYHKFTALKDCTVYEIYWVELETHDIEREDCGGM